MMMRSPSSVQSKSPPRARLWRAFSFSFPGRWAQKGVSAQCADPVTGSAHCALTPFWAQRPGKEKLKARQSRARGGDLLCTDDGERIIIKGDCALYLTGEIEL